MASRGALWNHPVWKQPECTDKVQRQRAQRHWESTRVCAHGYLAKSLPSATPSTLYARTGIRKELAICDTIHPPPSWRAARCPRDLAPVTLHAGKTSALSLDTELGNAHTWNHWHQEDVCDTIHPPPSWRAARCPREAENSGQDWACKRTGLVGRSSCAPTSCAPACWKDVRFEL